MHNTGQDHQHDETVILAAQWLAELKEPPQMVIPELRTRFGITTKEACEACALASDMRILRRAHA